jgi:hypothetical protein
MHMRLAAAAALLLSCSAAFAFPASAPKGTKVGADCTGPMKTLAPKLQSCPVAVGDKKSRVFCPNGKAFDLDEMPAPVPLARSLCELTQVSE